MHSKWTSFFSWLLMLVSPLLFIGFTGLAWLASFSDDSNPGAGDPGLYWMILLAVSFFRYVLLIYAISFLLLSVGAAGMIRRRAWGRKLLMSVFLLLSILSVLTFFIEVIVSFYLVDSGNIILLANAFSPSLGQLLSKLITTALWCGGFLVPVWYLKRESVRREFGLTVPSASLDGLGSNDA